MDFLCKFPGVQGTFHETSSIKWRCHGRFEISLIYIINNYQKHLFKIWIFLVDLKMMCLHLQECSEISLSLSLSPSPSQGVH